LFISFYFITVARVISKDASNRALIKLNPIVAFSVKKISKKTVNNLTNFRGKNNDDIKYTINNSRAITIKIFHQISGGVTQIKTAKNPAATTVINSFFIKVFLCICKTMSLRTRA